MKFVSASNGARVVLSCQDFAAYMPTVVDMVNTSRVEVQDLFTATMANMCARAHAAAQATFDSHVASIRTELPCEEPALRARLTAAQSDAAHAMDALPLDGGYRTESLAQLGMHVADVREHVLLDNVAASRIQCRGVWMQYMRSMEAQLDGFTSVDQLASVVSEWRMGMRSAMVGPYRDTVDMADEVSSWVLTAITSLGNRLGMKEAEKDAA